MKSTYWGGVVKLSNTQNNLLDVHQSDISKILRFKLSLFYIHQISPLHGGLSRSSPENKSHLLRPFFSSGFYVPVAERAHLLFLRGKIVCGINTTDSLYASSGNLHMRRGHKKTKLARQEALSREQTLN